MTAARATFGFSAPVINAKTVDPQRLFPSAPNDPHNTLDYDVGFDRKICEGVALVAFTKSASKECKVGS